ncbi:MAG TPA: hypothetical protein VNF99_12275 [Stellaceae bacterium]|nr:hypothetical protein [Stellaceae bacterium]
MTPIASRQRSIRGGVLMAALAAALIGGLSSVPARADNRADNYDRGRNVQQERSHREQRPARRYYPRRQAPSYVYSPPPVYYAPPAPPPAIDFVFPLNFR